MIHIETLEKKMTIFEGYLRQWYNKNYANLKPVVGTLVIFKYVIDCMEVLL